MGTNFYSLKGDHIGKRSAAGLYCWNCKKTLCEDGEEGIHYGVSKWSKECPICGEKAIEENLDNSSAGRELGFNKNLPDEKVGVASCSSFTWAMPKEKALKLKKIKDEYDRVFSKKEFLNILKECPVQYFDSIGVDFS